MRFPTDVCLAPLTRLAGSSMAPDRDKADDRADSGLWARGFSLRGKLFAVFKGEGWLLCRQPWEQPDTSDRRTNGRETPKSAAADAAAFDQQAADAYLSGLSTRVSAQQLPLGLTGLAKMRDGILPSVSAPVACSLKPEANGRQSLSSSAWTGAARWISRR